MQDLRDRLQRLQTLRELMQDGIHYGSYQGYDRPGLLKPGAELLMLGFQIAVLPIVETITSPQGQPGYRVFCEGWQTGQLLGRGLGECWISETGSNTALKTAKKRALVDLALTVTGASMWFTQDLDDLPPVAPATPAAPAGLGKHQRRLLEDHLQQTGLSPTQLCQQFNLPELSALPPAQLQAALDWIDQHPCHA